MYNIISNIVAVVNYNNLTAIILVLIGQRLGLAIAYSNMAWVQTLWVPSGYDFVIYSVWIIEYASTFVKS